MFIFRERQQTMDRQCSACSATLKGAQKQFTCTTCRDPVFVVCEACEPMSITYHHWNHSFLLIENRDAQTPPSDKKYEEKIINENKLSDERFSTILTKKHDQKCDSCLGNIYGIKYQSVGSDASKTFNLCDSCFHLPHRPENPQWSTVHVWLKIRSLYVLTQQPLKSFDIVDLKQDVENNIAIPPIASPRNLPTPSVASKPKSGYSEGALDPNLDGYAGHGPNIGADAYNAPTGQGRYEDNVHKGEYEYQGEDDENRTGVYMQSASSTKDTYEDNQYKPQSGLKGRYEDNEEDSTESKRVGTYTDKASYSYNEDKPTAQGTYMSNDAPHTEYEDSEYSYNAEDKPDDDPKSHSDSTRPNKGYGYNQAKSEGKSGYGYNAAKSEKSTYLDNDEPESDQPKPGYGYNASKSEGSVYMDNAEETPYSDNNEPLPKQSKPGYGYNKETSEETPYLDNSEQSKPGYGYNDNESQGYGYNASKSEGSVYMDNNDANSEDNESTDSDHSAADPFNVHQSAYLQDDAVADDDDEGYGASAAGYYSDRVGFYKHAEDPKKKQPAAQAPAPNPNPNNTRDWNEEFQNIMTMDDSTPELAFEKLHRMHLLSKEFTEKAVKLGKTIIEEVDKAADQKTIKPKNMGGIAGGEKYSEEGIFFKFAIDLFKIYGGDEFAIKAAGLELQGLRCLLQTNIKGLHYPLMILIDYRGYRLIATSMLPLDSNSLIYGSGDGAKTIKKEDKTFSKLMKQVGQKLNLKKHQVGFGAVTKRLYAPADIEGHRGKDGRYYLLDTARLFPAEPTSRNLTGLLIRAHDRTGGERWVPLPEITYMPSLVSDKLNRQLDEYLNSDFQVPVKIETEEFLDGTVYYTNRGVINTRASSLLGKVILGDVVLVMKGRKGAFLYNLLRPELVAAAPTPLSSDAYSPFGRHDGAAHNKEVENAWFGFIESVPHQVKEMQKELENFLPDKFTRTLHKFGLNARHVGLLRALTPSSFIADQSLVEMVTRIAKNYIRNRVRTSKAEDIKEIIVNHFNLLLGKGEASDFFWRFAIKTQIEAKFSKASIAMNSEEIKYNYDLRETVNKMALFQVLQEKVGVRFKESVLEKFTLNMNLFNTTYPFKIEDLDSIQVKVKHLLEPDLSEKIMAWIKENAAENNMFSPLKAAPFLEKFSIPNTEVSHLVMNQAFRLLIEKNYHTASLLLEKANDLIQGTTLIPLEVAVKMLYVKGCVALQVKDFSVAEKNLMAAYKILTVVSVTKRNEKAGRSDRPFLLLILNMLCKLYFDSGNRLATLYYTMQFISFWLKFPCIVARDDMVKLFGFPIPLPLQLKVPLERVSGGALEDYSDTVAKYVRVEQPDAAVPKQYLNSALSMEKTSGLLSLLALTQYGLEEIQDDMRIRINSSMHYYKDVSMAPRYIKADQLQTIALYQYAAKVSKVVIKTMKDKVVWEEEVIFKNYKATIEVDLPAGDYDIRSTILVQTNDTIHPVMDSTSRFTVVPPQNGDTGLVLAFNRKKNSTAAFTIPDDNPLEQTAVFHKDENPVFYALNRLGELWEMTYERPVATKVASLLPWKVVQICNSGTHCILLTGSGEVFTWGASTFGELGHGDITSRGDPRLVEKLKGIKVAKVFAYRHQSFAVTEDGVLYAWGRFADKGHKPAYLPLKFDLTTQRIAHVGAIRDLDKCDNPNDRDPHDSRHFNFFTTETGHVYLLRCSERDPPGFDFFEQTAKHFIVEVAVQNNQIYALDRNGKVLTFTHHSRIITDATDTDARSMYLQDTPMATLAQTCASTAAGLSTTGEIYFEERIDMLGLMPRIMNEMSLFPIHYFASNAEYIVAVPGAPPQLPQLPDEVLQKRQTVEGESDTLHNCKLELKIVDYEWRVHWAAPVSKNSLISIHFQCLDPALELTYGTSYSAANEKSGVWSFSPMFTEPDFTDARNLKVPLPGPSGKYQIVLKVDQVELVRSAPVVLDFADQTATLEPTKTEVMPDQPIVWKVSTRSRRFTELIEIRDVVSDMLVGAFPPFDKDVLETGEFTFTGVMEGARYYAVWNNVYMEGDVQRKQFLLRSREVVVKSLQKYLTADDILSFNLSRTHIKPSTPIVVSWKYDPNYRVTYKELLIIGRKGAKSFQEWFKLHTPKATATTEGSTEMVAPPAEGEYFVAIILTGLGYGGLIIKQVEFVVDNNAPDPTVEPLPEPVQPQKNTNADASSNTGLGGFSEKLIKYASLKTEFASWKDFLVHAGVNNAEMYGQVATAVNLPVSLIPMADSFLVAKLGIVDMQDVEKILLKSLEIREARIAKMITGTL